jgi:hypothetical protein
MCVDRGRCHLISSRSNRQQPSVDRAESGLQVDWKIQGAKQAGHVSVSVVRCWGAITLYLSIVMRKKKDSCSFIYRLRTGASYDELKFV